MVIVREGEVRSVNETESTTASHCGGVGEGANQKPERIYETSIGLISPPTLCVARRLWSVIWRPWDLQFQDPARVCNVTRSR